MSAAFASRAPSASNATADASVAFYACKCAQGRAVVSVSKLFLDGDAAA